LDAAFEEIVKTIDGYTHLAPLKFIEGFDASPGEHLFPNGTWRDGAFNKFHIWIERWMGAIYPRTLKHQRAIQQGKAGDDEYMELCYDGQRFGFLLGSLVGCRAMGASSQELLAKARAFTVDHLTWERDLAESDAKKSKE
jgi:hypothetical protein